MDIVKRCWAEVSLDALCSNLNEIRSLAGDSDIMCVVKANAYGHGDAALTEYFETLGVRHFAVAALNEAVHLRRSGVTGDILILGGCLEDGIPLALEYGITLTVFDENFAKTLSRAALECGKTAKVHIKLDTGMSRVGFNCMSKADCDKTADSITAMTRLDGVSVNGVFTHFAVSDEKDGEQYTKKQLERVLYIKKELESRGIFIERYHTSNAGGIMNFPDSHLDMVRAGILLYGLYEGYGKQNSFLPALSLKSVITHIHEIKRGDTVSYGRTFTADKPMRLATVAIGYADGLPRSLSNAGKMSVNGRLASIVGRVCMDQTVIDVTDIKCRAGDTVTVIGDGITAHDVAKLDNTINYETVCNISSRVPRVYLKDGKIYKITEYI